MAPSADVKPRVFEGVFNEERWDASRLNFDALPKLKLARNELHRFNEPPNPDGKLALLGNDACSGKEKTPLEHG